MKKSICVIVSLCCILFCGGCEVNEMSSLKDISKPYAAVYTCESLTYGNEELIEQYQKITLDLRSSGEFILNYSDRQGVEWSFDGDYTFGEKGVTFTCDNGADKCSFTFPYEKGVIYLSLPLAGRVLKAEFKL